MHQQLLQEYCKVLAEFLERCSWDVVFLAVVSAVEIELHKPSGAKSSDPTALRQELQALPWKELYERAVDGFGILESAIDALEDEFDDDPTTLKSALVAKIMDGVDDTPSELVTLRAELETLTMGKLKKRATTVGVSRARLREFLEREDRSEQRKAIITAVIEEDSTASARTE